MSTATAAAQLRANLMSHIAQLPSQPCSLPPAFVTNFVRRCFPLELDQVDFPQALTALDYLKDLEIRRRREVVAALDRLGVQRSDISHKDVLSKKYPGVLRWVIDIEEKERKIEATYTQVYIGLRRWTMINELSLTPFNKFNCIAMLNTVYPPTTIPTAQFVQPTAQLTPNILSAQRNGFFRYITAVEKNGTTVLGTLMDQHTKPGEATGWTSLRETLDNYLRMANSIIDECYSIGNRDNVSPVSASFSSVDNDDDSIRRKVGSGISFSTNTTTSARSSANSQATRQSTGSNGSSHSRTNSKEKPLPETPLPLPSAEVASKPPGSTLERIAREIKKIRSRGDLREASKQRSNPPFPDVDMTDAAAPTPPKERKLLHKLSLKKMRSNNTLREADGNRPGSGASNRDGEENAASDIPAFDVEEMKRRRMIYEAQEKKQQQQQQQQKNKHAKQNGSADSRMQLD